MLKDISNLSNLVKITVWLDARHARAKLNGYFSASLLKQPVPNLYKRLDGSHQACLSSMCCGLLPWTLVGFNEGVEAGQLASVLG